MNGKASPFVKWAGGKTQLLKEIETRLPLNFGTTIKKYAEPFVGGGSVFLHLLQHYDIKETYISDINCELVTTYRTIKEDVEGLIDALSEIESQYIPLSLDERKDYFYHKRAHYNLIKKDSNSDLDIAAHFIFLNRTCFNGLYRVNSKGDFNVPSGRYKNPLICNAKNLNNVSRLLKNVQIVCGDYKQSDSFIDENTFVYFDPPYRPLDTTSNFTSYTKDDFNDDDQIQLSQYIHHLSEKGAFILASNSDPKNINPSDDFFDVLYSPLHIERIGAARLISSKTKSRGKVSELLIRNY